jgi:hypothetical protein
MPVTLGGPMLIGSVGTRQLRQISVPGSFLASPDQKLRSSQPTRAARDRIEFAR